MYSPMNWWSSRAWRIPDSQNCPLATVSCVVISPSNVPCDSARGTFGKGVVLEIGKQWSAPDQLRLDLSSCGSLDLSALVPDDGIARVRWRGLQRAAQHQRCVGACRPGAKRRCCQHCHCGTHECAARP